MNARTFFCIFLGTLAGLAIAVLFRDQHTFVEPPDWIYGVGILGGGGVAFVARLLLDRIWKPEP